MDMRLLMRLFDVDAAEAEILAASLGMASPAPPARDPAPVLRFWPADERLAA